MDSFRVWLVMLGIFWVVLGGSGVFWGSGVWWWIVLECGEWRWLYFGWCLVAGVGGEFVLGSGVWWWMMVGLLWLVLGLF